MKAKIIRHNHRNYRLGDYISYVINENRHSTLKDGEIDMISHKGINIKHDDGSIIFVKWENVMI